MIRLLKSDKSV